MKNIDANQVRDALRLLNSRISRFGVEPLGLVVCGGSALIATGLISRTTNDVDVLALMDNSAVMVDAKELPEYLLIAAREVSEILNLPDDWLNSGPSDIFRMGLPEGFQSRLIEESMGSHLTIFFISRYDQIHFKLYASVDRGGYHIEDLLNLNPTEKELVEAGLWSCTHDVSEGYAQLLRQLLDELGYAHAAESL